MEAKLMKAFTIIAKLFAVLATAVGAIVLLATYGEKIVAWCKKTMDSFIEIVDEFDDDELEGEDDIDVEVEVIEEIEDAEPVEEVLVELADEAEEVIEEVVADEADFEG
jgi:hypothetical protein